MYLEFSRIFAFITSIILVAGLYAQVYKIFKTKSAKDFTLALLLGLLIDEIAWMNYGISIREWPVYMLGLTSLPAAIAAFVGYMKYGYRRNGNEHKS